MNLTLRKKLFGLVGVCSAFALLAPVAEGALLASGSASTAIEGYFSDPGAGYPLNLSWGVDDDVISPPPTILLFDETDVSIGDVFSVNNSHANWAAATAMMTNGISDVTVAKGSDASSAKSLSTAESTFFGLTTDFAGSTIDEIRLIVDDIGPFQPSNAFPFPTFERSFSYTVEVYGQVPTPGALALLGAAGVVGRRKRRRA